MITQYYRPQTLEEALNLISKPNTHPLGGGTVLAQRTNESFSVVDLQALGLDKLRKSGNTLEIGATTTLQVLKEFEHTHKILKTAIELEVPLNLRTMGTVAGTLVTCDGRSTFATVMLALDARLITAPNPSPLMLGNFLPLRSKDGDERSSPLQDKLITRIEIPLNVKLTFESVARTPADKPIICVALAQWPSGRTRLAIGGYGSAPKLAMDGNDALGIESSARDAFIDAGDEWASGEYRMEMAGILAKRCQDGINSLV